MKKENVVFGNLEGIEKKVTSKLSEVLAEGRMQNDKSPKVDFTSFINSNSFEGNKLKSKDEKNVEIVEAIQSGKTEFFNKIDSEYRKDLLSFANNKMRDFDLRDKREAAKDIVQQTLSNVFKAIVKGSFDKSQSLKGYLLSSTAKNCTYFMRENSAIKLPKFFEDYTKDFKFCDDLEDENTDFAQAENLTYEDKGNLEQIFNSLDVGELNVIMGKLKPEFRNVLELRFFSNTNHKEIAKALKITVSKSQDRVRFGLIKLKKLVEETVKGSF